MPIRWTLVRDPEGKFVPQALLCTDLAAAPEQVASWFVRRWQVESTFQEVRAHLGVETQRQWSEKAIARTTPALLGLFSLVTLLAHPHMADTGETAARQAAWYKKDLPTFSDALALVRRRLWRQRLEGFCLSPRPPDRRKPPPPWAEQMAEMLCYAN